jgi:hypothetical protein
MLLLGAASFAFAGRLAPEIDANAATGAITLLSGALLVLGARKRAR